MHLTVFKYGLLTFFLAVSMFAFSQDVKVSGIVTDSIGNPLELANVIALNKLTNKLASYSITNNRGEYKINLTSQNTYKLKVSFVGYKTINYLIDIPENSNDITKDFSLFEDKSILDEVTLTYEMPVTIKGDTIVYNADSFNTGTEKKLKDVMKNLPGVEINDLGQVEVEGKQVRKVMVEGKDFFDGDSKLAVENIPSNAVDKVEILKNYSEINQLRNVTNNEDDIAINIKLKEGKKEFWFGQVSAGGDLDKHYLVNPKLFYYSPDKSINIISNINNIGDISFDRRDYFKFTGGFRNLSSGSGTSLELSTGSDDLGFTMLKDNKANEIITRFGAANFSYSPNEKLDLSGFFIYSDTDTELLEIATKNYVDGAEELSETKSDQDNTLALAKFSSTYKPNINFQLDYDILLKLSDQTENSGLISSFADIENTINTLSKDNPFSINQNLNAYYTLNERNIFSGEFQSLISEEEPFYNATFLDLGIDPSKDELPFLTIFPYNINQDDYSVNQNKSIKTNKLEGKIDYYYLLNNKSHLNFTVGSIISEEKLNTNIFQVLDDDSQYDFTEYEFNNNTTYNFTDLFLGLHYKFVLGKFTFDPGMSVHNYNTENTQFGGSEKENKTKFLADFYVNYKFKDSENLRFKYAMTTHYPSINKLAEAYVFNNYNSLFLGNRTIKNGLYQNYNLFYSSFSLFNFTNVIASVNYSKKKDAIKYKLYFEEINRISTPVNSPFEDESLTGNARWERTFGKYKVSLRANFIWSNYYNLVNDDINNSKEIKQDYTGSVSTNFKKGPNFEVGYKWIKNDYDYGTSTGAYYTNKPFARMDVKFLKNFMFNVDYSFYDYSDGENTLNTYSFLDADLTYQKADSKWEFKLGMTNILDTKSINQDSFNEIFTSTTEYFVQPRYAIFSVKYNL